MAHLSISCLGPLQVMLAGRPVTGFKSNKVRALLTYLAVEADRPHGREVLAGLLWPEWPDREALSNLRYALSNLRRAIGDHTASPSYLLITRDTLQFNTASDYWLDVTAFFAQTESVQSMERDIQDLSPVEKAISLYQGGFLEGFSLRDSGAFEEWTLLKQGRIAQQLMCALRYLVTAYEQCGQYEQAQTCARRQIELEPWDEVAHQLLMRTLALSGQRSAALVQYETCRRLLSEELGVEPAQETTKLYEQIQTGMLQSPEPPPAAQPDLTVGPPRFLEEESPPIDIPLFVAREFELAQLDGFLDLAMTGQGRVAFVTGDAGSGKTALVQEFSRRSQEACADLVVASGNCNAYTGIGDPYLPFREILEELTGDVEAKWAAGAITGDYARRLWNTLPLSAQALVETGQDLIGTFVLHEALRERVMTCTLWPGRKDWLNRMDELVERKPATGPGPPSSHQSDLFEQYTRVLQALAQKKPLLLVVDDLQWADLGSISLLFHLGRRMASSRILLVGAYRPEEVALGREGERHPLEPVVNEFQRDFADVSVNVDRAGRRDFVEAFLDSECNRFRAAFREMVYQQTRGHPLFTIELLRGMQERGDLIQDPEGWWIEGPTLDWETLPARVEAAIAERIGRLDQPLRAALRVASVEGEDFTAEVMTRVLGTDEREMVSRLSSELDRRHRLVRAQAIERLGSRRVSRYRFRNYLFQKYLYDSLDEVERAYFHEDVGNALEDLYGDRANEIEAIAPQLARHFQEARIKDKAIHYLYQAGERAVQLCAYREGLAHLNRGLSMLMSLPHSPEHAKQELVLQLALGIAWQGAKGARSSEVKQAYTRARELSHQTGNTSQLCLVLGQIAVFHYVGAEYQTARELTEEALDLAYRVGDPLLVAVSHWALGYLSFSLGEHTTARAHLEQVISFYEPQAHHHPFVVLGGKDAGLGALAYDACCLWCLGYPEQAMKRSQEALTLARELDHPFSLADVLCFAGCKFHAMRRDAEALKGNAEELMRLANEKVPGWQGTGPCYRGEALAMQGQIQEGIEQMREGLKIEQSMGERCYLSGTLGTLALAQAKAGRIEEGLDTLAETFALVEETDERHWEAELYRLRAELLLMKDDDAGAEATLQKAIEVARSQKARSLELRATTSLARLWQKQNRTEEARQVLERIYGWFTEGFDTPDLKEAKALLEALS